MRLIHLSDLHFGRHDADLANSLLSDIRLNVPDLIVVSGDFTQVGSESEFAQARTFLDSFPAPVFAVPGNHDVPARNLLLRFADPYRHYRRHIASELEPFLTTGGVAIAGLKTSRRFRLGLNWAHGSIAADQLDLLEERFSQAAPESVRIVVAHHPLLQPEEPMARPMRLVRRADEALACFARLGVRLVLSGHFHMSYLRHHHVATGETEGPLRSAAAPIMVLQAASAISTRVRDHANAYNVIDIAGDEIAMTVREWQAGSWRSRLHEARPLPD
ncbi:3',5'-cyclic AMP phosphodiesterase CpdA [Pseudorhizobium tarimense]|uniref:3',5'-cyclic AMP phosphodiesterase CpdA n=1 Tax=Pseudorhizobium tarimense TaxID=1079109 RepID=A0ABV2H6N0_9HYPH|nr:metallophosphoesterase [Pseudorhizobium tarimense]MCJ8519463.1 metallophosphoesterase [Pseudorhizobium tarimense]